MTTRNTITNTILAGGLLLSGASTALATPGYEDLPLGSLYLVSDATMSDGIQIEFGSFQWWSGTWTSAGEARVGNAGWACTPNQELGLNNITASLNYGASGHVPHLVQFNFGEYGGNINVSINGDFRNVANFIDLNGMNIGGADFHVTSGGLGNDCGTVEIHGPVQKLELGGQELWIDNLTSTPNDPCQYGYEDLAGISVGNPGDTFTTGDIDLYVNGFQWYGGTWTYDGYISVVSTGLACATGQELLVNNATVLHDFAGSVGSMENVSIQFGEYGGNINVEINGDLRNVANFRDLDGTVIGGVLVSIPWGGFGGDCGTMELTGTVDTLGIGGQELWLDCLEGDAIEDQDVPGDANGDDDVNVMDLLEVIQSWGACSGSCPADLNGDGTVDVMDLLMVLENWN